MVQRHDVAVVVDSSSCLPSELLRQWNITVVPHQLVVGDRSLRDGVDILPEEFYRLLAQDPTASMSTAAPQPGHFLEGFLAASQRASNVLCLTLPTEFSATYRSACAAAASTNGRLAGARVQVLDSRAAAGASGLIALAAARWAATGMGLDELVSRVQQLVPRVGLLAYVDTIRYLRRSGRVRQLDAFAGALLNIKPLTELCQGEARVLEKPRGRANAARRLVGIMQERVSGKPVVVNVMEANAAKDADALRCRIQDEFDCRELITSQFTPVMGLHTGPGLLGVAFYVDEEDQSQPVSP